MRTVTAASLLAIVAGVVWAADDERDKKIAEQKKQAEAAWKALEVGDYALAETKHLLVLAPKETPKKQLDARAAAIESYHDKALAAAGLEEKDAYPGKITVYLLTEKE